MIEQTFIIHIQLKFPNQDLRLGAALSLGDELPQARQFFCVFWFSDFCNLLHYNSRTHHHFVALISSSSYQTDTEMPCSSDDYRAIHRKTAQCSYFTNTNRKGSEAFLEKSGIPNQEGLGKSIKSSD